MVPDLNDDTALAHRRVEGARWDGSGSPTRRWNSDNPSHGATAVEYALMVALVIAVIVVLVATVGRQVFDLYHTVPTF